MMSRTFLVCVLLVLVACCLSTGVSADEHSSKRAAAASPAARGGSQQQLPAFANFTAAVDAANATANSGNLSILFAAVQAAGALGALNASMPYTVFAPTDQAFTQRLREDLNITPAALLLPANNATLLKVLSYHVVPGAAANSSSLTNGQKLVTALAGAEPLTVRLAPGKKPRIVGATNAATVTTADVRVGLSVIHIVNDVLLPQGVGKGSGKNPARRLLSVAGRALQQAEQLPAMDSANATSGSGSGNGNGTTASYPTFMDAVVAANTTANLTTLVAAVEAAGVASAINDTTAWTILAPSNAAFEKRLALLNLTAAQLLDPANKPLLITILSYHVLPAAALKAGNLTNGTAVSTALANDGNITVVLTDAGNVTFVGASNNATVVAADIMAGASVIHVIDDVLVPPMNATANASTPAAASDATNSSTTSSGGGGSGMMEASSSPAPAPDATGGSA